MSKKKKTQLDKYSEKLKIKGTLDKVLRVSADEKDKNKRN